MSEHTIPFPGSTGRTASPANSSRSYLRTGPGSAIRAVTLPEDGLRPWLPDSSVSRAMAIASSVERHRQPLAAPKDVSAGRNATCESPRRYGAGLHLVSRSQPAVDARLRLPHQLRSLVGRWFAGSRG